MDNGLVLNGQSTMRDIHRMVLILIVVDNGLVLWSHDSGYLSINVLILIVVDNGLVQM